MIAAILRTAAANRVSLMHAAYILDDTRPDVEPVALADVIEAIHARTAAQLPDDTAGAYWDQCLRAAEGLP